MATRPQRERRATRPGQRGRPQRLGATNKIKPDEEEDKNTGGSVVVDLIAAPLRGAEELARDVLELPNIIPGVDYDLGEGRIFGRARTGIGHLATGIMEFGLGFAPGIGLLGKFGKFGRTFDLTNRAQVVARRAGKPIRAIAIELGRGTLAGAAVDFTIFDANEERLANLIQKFPALQNPITAFLEHDDDEGQIEGRLKQVLEGATIGFLADTLMISLRGLKAQRKARAEGKSAKQIKEAVNEAAPLKESREASDRAYDGPPVPDPEVDTRSRTLEVPSTESTPGTREKKLRKDPIASDTATLKELSRTRAGREKLLKERLRMTPRQIAQAEANFKQRREQGSLGDFADMNDNVVTDPAINPRTLSPDQRILLGVDAKGLNLTGILADNDVGFLYRAYEAIFGPLPRGEEARLVVPDEQMVKESLEAIGDIVGATPDMMGARLAKGAKDTAEALAVANRRAVGHRHMSEILGRHMISTLIDADTLDVDTMGKLMNRMEEWVYANQFIKDGASEQGLGLRSNQIANDQDRISEILRAITEAGGPEQVRRTAEMLQMAFGDGGIDAMAAAAKLSRMTISQKFWALNNEFWLNSILSAARTITTNIVSPMLTSIYRPLEHMVGGALTGQMPEVRKGINDLIGLVKSTQDAVKMSRKAWREGAVLDPRLPTRDDPFAAFGTINPYTLGIDPNSAHGMLVAWMGKGIRLPSRILMSGDEFVKQLNYRGHSYALLADEGAQQGLRGARLVDHIEDGMERLTQDGQRYSLETVTTRAQKRAAEEGIKDPIAVAKYVGKAVGREFDPGLSRVADAAIARAREVSFTAPLARGSLSSKAAGIVNEHPYFRMIAPFIRTPVNIATFAARRIPNPMGITSAAMHHKMPADLTALESLRSSFARDVLSGDPDKVADAVGRQAMGVGMVMTFATFAASGTITGRGPSDQEQRRLLQAAGWQPYSVRVAGKWVSYLRLDPFATIIGTVADLYDYSRMAPLDEQDNIATATMGAAFALANNFTNKTYLQGISDVMDALSDPQRNMPRVLGQYAASYVPSALAQAVEVVGDPYMREVHNLNERIRARTPYASDTVPVLRNIFGEKVIRPRGFALGMENLPGVAGDIMSMMSPIVYRDSDDNLINSELVALQHGFSPPPASRDGVDLLAIKNGRGQPAYDRWLQLHGKVRIQGRTLKQELRKLISSGIYRALSPISTAHEESPRVAAIQGVVRKFRQVAWDQMMDEFPQVDAAITRASRERRAFLAGNRQNNTAFGFQQLSPIQPLAATIGGIGNR